MASTSTQISTQLAEGDLPNRQQRPAQEELSVDRLRSRVRTEGRLGDNEERRRTWLYLLDVPYIPTATYPPGRLNGAGTVKPNQLPGASVAEDRLGEDANPLHSPVSSMEGPSSQVIHTQTNSDDRPAGYNSSCDETFFAGPAGEDWKVAESKRSKRKRGRAGSPDVAKETGVTSVFNSVVDLGDPQSRGDLDSPSASSFSRNPSPSSTSKIATASNGKDTSPSRAVWAQTSFSDLPVDDPGGDSSQSSDMSEDEAEGEEEGVKQNGIAATKRDRADHAAEKYGPLSDAECDKLQTSYDDDLPEHRDEQQVEKDTRRGFNGFQLGAAWTSATLQARRRQLRDVVAGVLRRHPLLCYYQGYHDVVSVLLLTLSPNHPCGAARNPAASLPDGTDVWASKQDFETVLLASERLSLYYLRDFMTSSFEPSLGWLKVFRDTLRRTDPAFSNQVVEQISPLPVFALSWLITAMSHTLDKDSEEVKRIFDLVLLEGPAAIVCVVVALVMQAKDRLFPDYEQSKDTEDPSELHHSFSTIPDMLGSPKTQASDGSNGKHNGPSISADSSEDEGDTAPTRHIRVEELLSVAQKLGAQLQWGLDSDPQQKASESSEKGQTSVMGPYSVLHTWSGPPACVKSQFASTQEKQPVDLAPQTSRQTKSTVDSKTRDRPDVAKKTKGESQGPRKESEPAAAPALSLATARSSPTESSWASLDASTESYLSPDNSTRIVLNAVPTPPAFDDEGPHGKEGSYFGADAGKDGGKRAGGKRGKSRGRGDSRMALVQRTGKILLVGALLVGGAAIFLGSGSGGNGNGGALRGFGGSLGSATLGLGGLQDRAQRSKLLQELSQVGRGIVGVAVCAAGAC